ncbi:MAG: AI-2E family transporter [Clostridium sp.]|nr:AI-2E family transporter [Clostridium sp.]
MLKKEITFDRFIRGLLLTLGAGAAIFTLNYLSDVLLPFFVAWILAYMLYPTVKFFQYRLRVKNRTVSIVLAMLTGIIIIGLTLYLIVPPVISEIIKFRNLAGDYLAHTNYGEDLWVQLESYLKKNIDQNVILRLIHENNLVEAIRITLSQLWSVVYHTVDFLLGIFASFIILLYMFFILLDYESLSKGWIKLVPKGSRDFAVSLASDVERGMNAYFRGQALVALLVGILFSIGFLIIDFPLAIGLGLFIGFLNLVPYLQLIGFIPTILLALLKAANTGENFWWILLSALLVFAVVQAIQDMVLVPKIMGKIMGLNPAVILLSLSIWGSLLGMIGLIIALPSTTLLLSYYRRFIAKDEREWEEAQGTELLDSTKE